MDTKFYCKLALVMLAALALTGCKGQMSKLIGEGGVIGSELKGTLDQCHSDTQCDDGNVCTQDACVEAGDARICVNAPLDDDTACNDGDQCTENNSCQMGSCSVGTPVDCPDDGNACTIPLCNSGTGCAVTNLGDGTACDDGDLCTENNQCLNGDCSVGDPVVCEDNNPCTTNACFADAGCDFSEMAVDGTPCADMDLCNGDETCQAGNCQAGAALECEDGNECTADSCDPAAGCVYTDQPDGTVCDDANACTDPDACQAGQCLGEILPADTCCLGDVQVLQSGVLLNNANVLVSCDANGLCDAGFWCMTKTDGNGDSATACVPENFDVGCYCTDMVINETGEAGMDFLCDDQNQPGYPTTCRDDGTPTCLAVECPGNNQFDCSEHCGNGWDEDGDGAIDCLDEDCFGKSCGENMECQMNDATGLPECLSTCVPVCDGLECGDDGCGGSCGSCGDGELCSAGLCVCAPVCMDSLNACGDDGCGGSCGDCTELDVCSDEGLCVLGVPKVPEMSTNVNCADGVDNDEDGFVDCDDLGCVDDPSCMACVPQCDGLNCGSDGCGGECGTCAANEICSEGMCECVPACAFDDGSSMECGDDGCGGSCGGCQANETCNAGLCECVPACDGLNCGDDGCGGSCGTCADTEQCTAGQCELIPVGCATDADCTEQYQMCLTDPASGQSDCGIPADGLCVYLNDAVEHLVEWWGPPPQNQLDSLSYAQGTYCSSQPAAAQAATVSKNPGDVVECQCFLNGVDHGACKDLTGGGFGCQI